MYYFEGDNIIKEIYKIKITNWLKYNADRKKSYRKVMVSERFLDDDKISGLTPIKRLLFLSCLLNCSESECGEANVCTNTLSRQSGVKPKLIRSALDELQSLQVLSYEKIEVLYKRNEMKLKEEKVKENKYQVVENSKISEPEKRPEKNTELNRKIWTSYQASYLLRYKVEPTRNASVNSQISQLAKRLGEDAVEIVKFYLSHNDTFYVSKAHSIGLCLRDAESLSTQWKRGAQITKAGLRRFESNVEHNELLNAIDRGEV